MKSIKVKEKINTISAHGVGNNNQIFIWSSNERYLSLYYLYKGNKNVLQFIKEKQHYGNHSNISQQGLPKFILCAADNEIVLFSINNTPDHSQDSEVKYERCNKEWFNSNNSMADHVANGTVADAAFISCRFYEEGDCSSPSIRVHTWSYHDGKTVFYVLNHASNNALIYKHCNLCPFTATKLNRQMMKIEEALNIKMTLPQFLLEVDGNIVSKSVLKLCDKYKVVYEKSKESKHDCTCLREMEDTCVNVLLSGLPQT
jgi:hypothetical protein